MSRINTNVSSLTAQNALVQSQNQLQTALTRLSTGLRINSGADDPAGLIASQVLGSDIVSANAGISNSQVATELISTADSALGQVSDLLNNIRGLVSDAANTGALTPIRSLPISCKSTRRSRPSTRLPKPRRSKEAGCLTAVWTS